MKKMKKVLKSILASLSLVLVGCSGMNDSEEVLAPKNSSRKDELVQIALTGDYVSSVEEMESGILSLLAGDSTSRSASYSDCYKLNLVDVMEVKMPKSAAGNRSAQIADYGSSEFYLYDVENTASGTSGFAIGSTDRRMGNVIAVIEDGKFSEDISDDQFMQVFATGLENYIQETSEIWNDISDVDLSRAAGRSATETVVKSGNYTYSNWKWNSGNEKCRLKTTWNQGYYNSTDVYNDAIAAVYGTAYYTGCVTTAVAQIMAFHEYPKTCREQAYNVLKNKWSKAASWNGSYEWNKMKANPNALYLSESGKTEVGALMYDIMSSVATKKDSSGTGAPSSSVNSYLTNLGYYTDYLMGYSYSTIQGSIDRGWPVYISGFAFKTVEDIDYSFLWWKWTSPKETYSSGHAWVIDGYANLTCKATSKSNSSNVQTLTGDYVYCNLGWGGSKNGYYLSEAFNTRLGPVFSDKTSISRGATTYGNDYNFQ